MGCEEQWAVVRAVLDTKTFNERYKELVEHFVKLTDGKQMSDVVNQVDFMLKQRHDQVAGLLHRFAEKVVDRGYSGVESVKTLSTESVEIAKHLADFDRWWPQGPSLCEKAARVAQVVAVEMSLYDTPYFAGFNSFLSNFLEILLSSESRNGRLSEAEREAIVAMKAAVDAGRKSWFRRREWVVLLVFLLLLSLLVVLSIVLGWTRPESDEDGSGDWDGEGQDEEGRRERRGRKSAIRVKY